MGEVLAANLLGGGFRGDLMFVNRGGRPLHGQPAYASVADLPKAPDLAVIATPAATVPGFVAELGARGCPASVVISAGFEGNDPAAARLRQALIEAAGAHLMRIVGPNCLGLLSPAHGVNASFARGPAPAGRLAMVAQSGAVAAAALDWAPGQGLGFSHVVTLGDSLDLDVGDLLDFLGGDPATDVILLYVESLRDAPKFMSAASFAARAKPVVLLKGGRSDSGAKAAFSHTRALAGADAVYAAAFRRAGVLQVDGLDELLDTALLFARTGAAAPDRLTVLTNGGGAGVLAVDTLEPLGGGLTVLSSETQATLRRLTPPNGTVGNPVDILGDAGPELYARALTTLLAAPEVEAVLTINCPTAVADSGLAAEAVVAADAAQTCAKPVLAAWLGDASMAQARRTLTAAGVPSFLSAEAAVRSFVRLTQGRRLQAQLLEERTSDAGAGDLLRARAVVGGALSDGRTALEPLEAQSLLEAYGVPVLKGRAACTPAEAGELAAALGGEVALKILSRDISHKSDVGGVELGLSGRVRTQRAAQDMQSRIASSRPDARLDGFLVQPMINRPQAQEVLAGVVRDPTFGPVVVVGQGGVAVEVLADRAVGLPPLDAGLARELIGRTRVSRLLAGFRDRPAADFDALTRLLVALGRLAMDLPEVAELDLNPVLCDAAGVLVVDSRVAVRTPDVATAQPAVLPVSRA